MATHAPATRPQPRPGRPSGPAPRTPKASDALQPKLEVTPSGDRWETEADRVADHVADGGASGAFPAISALVAPPRGQRAAKTGTPESADEVEVEEKTSGPKPAQREAVQRAMGEQAVGQLKPAPVPDRAAAEREAKAAREKAKRSGPSAGASAREDAPAQRDAQPGAGGFTVPATTEASVAAMRAGGGMRLPAATQRLMEERIGHDFADVRVHDGPAAHRAADALDARAFTVGRDVFFARGAFDPETRGGQRLIAHELTHTVQQAGGSAQAARVQRNANQPQGTTDSASQNTKDPAPDPRIYRKSDTEIIDASSNSLTVPKLKLPKIDGKWKGENFSEDTTAKKELEQTSTIDGTPPFVLHRPTKRKGTQRDVWYAKAKEKLSATLKDAIEDKAEPEQAGTTKVTTAQGEEVLYLRPKGGQARNVVDLMIGTPGELAEHPNMLLPTWNTSGSRRHGERGYHVDHLHELQLGGADAWENLWLLHAKANTTAGGKIKAAIEAPIQALAADAKRDGFWTPERAGMSEPSLKDLKKAWSTTFMAYAEEPLGVSRANAEYYTKEAIEGGDQLQGLALMTDQERLDTGLGPVVEGAQPEEFAIFPSRTGGTRFTVKKHGDTWRLHNRRPETFLGGFSSFEISYDFAQGEGGRVGEIVGTPKPTSGGKLYSERKIGLINDPRLGYSVYMDAEDLRKMPRKTFPLLSPVTFDSFGVGPDGLLAGHGRITATAYLFPGLEVPFSVHGDRIRIDYPLPTDSLQLGPVSIDEAALILGFDADGVVLGGTAAISVARLGRGNLEATAGREGAQIAGDFTFDMDFLEEPTARFLYDFAEESLTLSLDAGVRPHAIPGVAGGHITGTFTKETIELSGELTPAGFLSGTTLAVGYTSETGLTIEARDVPLPLEDVPAIRDARVTVGVNRDPDGVWQFYGSGGAEFDVRGVTGGLVIAVRDQVVTITGTGAVAYGPASGELSVTATNQEVDENGQPVEGEALDRFRVWGQGSVTIQFGSILSGTAGIELTEQGEIIVTGEIGLPPDFEVFPERRYEKDLLHIEPPEFPIWGVSVAGVGIGIFAFVDARLDFDAFVGPGVLTETVLTASYNFARPEEATVEGDANFDVPAGAGFTLDVGGGLRARAATAQVSGRVGLDARLGIEANAGASVAIDWTPADGLALSARAEARARPKFEIGANASVTASVDLLVSEPSYTWGPWREELGSFGPEMEVGVAFPISWSERNGLDLSLDNIEVTRPQIDAGRLMKDAFLELV